MDIAGEREGQGGRERARARRERSWGRRGERDGVGEGWGRGRGGYARGAGRQRGEAAEGIHSAGEGRGAWQWEAGEHLEALLERVELGKQRIQRRMERLRTR